LVSKSKITRSKKTQPEFKLSIGIKDFGPINSGKIDLKPLTIFIGPNNSGKSYAAVLINAIQNANPYVNNTLSPFRIVSIWSDSGTEYLFEIPSEKIRLDFKKAIEDASESSLESELKNKFRKLFQSYIDIIYIKNLQQRISNSFSTTLSDLIRKGTEKATLHIETSKINIILDLCENKIHRRSDNILEILESYKGIFIELSESKGKKHHFEDKILKIIIKFLDDNFRNIVESSFYLPAARAGILQAHNAIVSSLIRDAAHVGIRKFEIPKLSEVLAIFLDSIVSMTEKKGDFFDLACELEKELIQGEITISRTGEFKLPEIKYKTSGMEISIQRASSSVSELAPIILYMKHYLRPGSILIIEEPEAHLHPNNQYILAKYLVRLVRRNVHIVITTHSDYLLEQINNSIFRSELKEQKKSTNDDDVYVKKDEVAVYLFKPNEKKGGFNIEPVSITDDEGISDDEFSNIVKCIYDESVSIQKRLHSKK